MSAPSRRYLSAWLRRLPTDRIAKRFPPDPLVIAASVKSALRLSAVNDAAAARGHVLLAQTSLAKLLGDYPGSALRPRALIKAATLAWQRGDTRRALDLVAAARNEELRGDEAAHREALAWQIGIQTGDREAQAEAARRLLVSFPLQAADLSVIEIFRNPDGSLSWPSILTGDKLKRLRMIIHVELAAVVLIVLCAAIMAKDGWV